MKKLVFIILMMCSSVFAQTLDMSKLTAAQQAELAAKVEQMSTPVNTSVKVREEVSAWAEMGANLGKAIVAGAKEIGVAADDFSKTTPGKIVIAITVYKIIGQDIIQLVIGSLVFLIPFSIFLFVLTAKEFRNQVYEKQQVLWGLWTRNVLVSYEQHQRFGDDTQIISAVIAILAGAISLLIIF